MRGPYRNVIGGASYATESLCFDGNDERDLIIGGKITYVSDGSTHGFITYFTGLLDRTVQVATVDDLITGFVAVKWYANLAIGDFLTAFGVGYTSTTEEVILGISVAPFEVPTFARKFTVGSTDHVLPQAGLLLSLDGEDLYLLGEA